MRGCDNKNSHGTRGCRAHVEALAGLPDALRGRLVEAPEISRDVPAKTLTEQGAHMSKLLDVVTTVTDRRVADALLLGGVEAPEGPRDIQGCASKNSHGTRGCRARVEASGCALRPLRMAQLRGFRNGHGLGAARPCEALGGLEVLRGGFQRVLQEVCRGLGFIPLHLRGRAP